MFCLTRKPRSVPRVGRSCPTGNNECEKRCERMSVIYILNANDMGMIGAGRRLTVKECLIGSGSLNYVVGDVLAKRLDFFGLRRFDLNGSEGLVLAISD